MNVKLILILIVLAIVISTVIVAVLFGGQKDNNFDAHNYRMDPADVVNVNNFQHLSSYNVLLRDNVTIAYSNPQVISLETFSPRHNVPVYFRVLTPDYKDILWSSSPKEWILKSPIHQVTLETNIKTYYPSLIVQMLISLMDREQLLTEIKVHIQEPLPLEWTTQLFLTNDTFAPWSLSDQKIGNTYAQLKFAVPFAYRLNGTTVKAQITVNNVLVAESLKTSIPNVWLMSLPLNAVQIPVSFSTPGILTITVQDSSSVTIEVQQLTWRIFSIP